MLTYFCRRREVWRRLRRGADRRRRRLPFESRSGPARRAAGSTGRTMALDRAPAAERLGRDGLSVSVLGAAGGWTMAHSLEMFLQLARCPDIIPRLKAKRF